MDNVINVIVVPLDGSALAEQALQPAYYLAHRLHAAVEIVHVYEPTLKVRYASGAPPIDTRFDAELRQAAVAYLDAIFEREVEAADMTVSTKLLEGPVVKTLAAHVAALDRPLVVMTTHGRSGIGRALVGSVAEWLVRSATVPVLAIRARTASEPAIASRFGRVLVPIAGAEFGTHIVERTAGIFGTSEVEYVLFHAVLPVPILNAADPAIIPSLVDMDAEKKAANDLLADLSEPLRARGARVTTLIVIDANPASAIRAAASDTNADVISMATHGHRGVKRLVLGSVADSVLRHATVPLLLVRPSRSAAFTEDQEAEGVAVT